MHGISLWRIRRKWRLVKQDGAVLLKSGRRDKEKEECLFSVGVGGVFLGVGRPVVGVALHSSEAGYEKGFERGDDRPCHGTGSANRARRRKCLPYVVQLCPCIMSHPAGWQASCASPPRPPVWPIIPRIPLGGLESPCTSSYDPFSTPEGGTGKQILESILLSSLVHGSRAQPGLMDRGRRQSCYAVVALARL